MRLALIPKINLAVFNEVLTSPTAAFTKFAEASPQLQQQLGLALRASGLIEGINYIANTFGNYTNGSSNSLVVNSRHFTPTCHLPMQIEPPALNVSTYRWNKDLHKRVSGNYEEELEISVPDNTPGLPTKLLAARVIKTNAYTLESPGTYAYIIDGMNLPALREAMPDFHSLINSAPHFKRMAP